MDDTKHFNLHQVAQAWGFPVEEKSRFYPGEIARAYPDGTFDVKFEDGKTEAHLTAEYIHLVDGGDGANSNSSVRHFAEGMKVEARSRYKKDDSMDSNEADEFLEHKDYKKFRYKQQPCHNSKDDNYTRNRMNNTMKTFIVFFPFFFFFCFLWPHEFFRRCPF